MDKLLLIGGDIRVIGIHVILHRKQLAIGLGFEALDVAQLLDIYAALGAPALGRALFGRLDHIDQLALHFVLVLRLRHAKVVSRSQRRYIFPGHW